MSNATLPLSIAGPEVHVAIERIEREQRRLAARSNQTPSRTVNNGLPAASSHWPQLK